MRGLKNRLLVFAATCLTTGVFSPSVLGQESQNNSSFSYSYLEASFMHRMDGLDVQLVDGGVPSDVLADDGNGFFLRGSIEVQDGVFLFATYEREESDYGISAPFGGETVSGDFDVKFQNVAAGLGYIVNVNENLDLYFQAGLTYGEFRAGTGTVAGAGSGTSIPIDFSDESQSGVSGVMEFGVRTRLTNFIEFDGAVNYNGARKLELADADSLQLSGEFGARAAVRFLVTDTFSLGAEYQQGSSDRLLATIRARF